MSESPVLNWSPERQRVTSFFRSERSVLHLLGSDRAYVSHFESTLGSLVKDEFGESGKLILLDPAHDFTVASPYAVMCRIFQNLEQDTNTRTESPQHVSVNIGTGNSAGGSVDVSGNRVIVQGHSEREELRSLQRAVASMLDTGSTFSGVVLLFRNCHRLKAKTRRIFFASLWEPTLEAMTLSGMKVIFSYCPHDLREQSADQIPATAHESITMPETFEGASYDDALEQLQMHVEQVGLESPGLGALGFARGVLFNHQSVRDVYHRITLRRLDGLI